MALSEKNSLYHTDEGMGSMPRQCGIACMYTVHVDVYLPNYIKIMISLTSPRVNPEEQTIKGCGHH